MVKRILMRVYSDLRKKDKLVLFLFVSFLFVLNVMNFTAINIDEQTSFLSKEIVLDSITTSKSSSKVGYAIYIHSQQGQLYLISAEYSECAYLEWLEELSKGEKVTVEYLDYYDWRSFLNGRISTFGLSVNGKSFFSKSCIYSESSNSKWVLLCLSPLFIIGLVFFYTPCEKSRYLRKLSKVVYYKLHLVYLIYYLIYLLYRYMVFHDKLYSYHLRLL